jgi:hypothetical protein
VLEEKTEGKINQWHVVYRDGAGTIWDSWYDGQSGKWNLRQINAA